MTVRCYKIMTAYCIAGEPYCHKCNPIGCRSAVIYDEIERTYEQQWDGRIVKKLSYVRLMQSQKQDDTFL